MTFIQPTHLQSYGRRRGRKLRASRSALVETLLPKLLITLPEQSPSPFYQGEGGVGGALRQGQNALLTPSLILPLIEGGGNKRLWFEIGFGGGENLVEQAKRHPDINFIGCEPYINGMVSLLSTIDMEKLVNIRLYDGDARLLLERLPDGCIERLFVLFPDPWPKVRHHKRRLISQDTLALFHRKLEPSGLLRLATDHEDYGVWMLEHLLAFKKFQWTARTSADWKTPPSDWVRTRYQSKAEVEGRKAMFMDWIKRN